MRELFGTPGMGSDTQAAQRWMDFFNPGPQCWLSVTGRATPKGTTNTSGEKICDHNLEKDMKEEEKRKNEEKILSKFFL